MHAGSNLHRILLAAVNRTTASDEVIRTAVGLSTSSIGMSGELHFVHVVDSKLASAPRRHPFGDVIVEASTYLDALVSDARVLTSMRVAGHVAFGRPVPCILQIATELGADVVIVGTDDKRGLSWLFGSVSRKILRRAPCAVLLARARGDADAHDVELACRACTDLRFATGGEQPRCAQHAAHRAQGQGPPNAVAVHGGGSTFLRSEV